MRLVWKNETGNLFTISYNRACEPSTSPETLLSINARQIPRTKSCCDTFQWVNAGGISQHSRHLCSPSVHHCATLPCLSDPGHFRVEVRIGFSFHFITLHLRLARCSHSLRATGGFIRSTQVMEAIRESPLSFKHFCPPPHHKAIKHTCTHVSLQCSRIWPKESPLTS